MDQLYCVNPDYMLREIAGEYAIIPVGEECVITNAVITPNDTAVFIWQQLEEPNTINNIVEQALKEYDAPREIIERDIVGFIQQSVQIGAIQLINK